MKKTSKRKVADFDRLHLGKLINERKLTLPLLAKRLEGEGFSLSMDGEGDIYVSDEALGYPFWVTLDRENKVVILYTFQEYATDTGALDAYETIQRVRLGPLTPQFILQGHRLYAHYFLSYREFLVVSHVYEAACRFAEYAISLPPCEKGGSDSLARVLH
jgi:hypothetical protein